MTGFIALLAAVGLSAVVALGLRAKNGRFSATHEVTSDALSAAEIGVPLGDRATLVQFSSAFCAPCRATRVLLTDIAASVEGVVTVDIDAESHLDMVRRLDIMRTPTVLVLDSSGGVVTRASGLPRRDQVMSALGHAVANPR